MHKLTLNILLSVIVFYGCYGPPRFVTKELQKNNSHEYSIDSVRITRALYSKNDTTMRFALDLDFTEEELQEIFLEEETKPITDINQFLISYRLLDTTNSIPTSYERFLMSIINYIGTPYKFGGNTRKGLDCSAFTQLVFLEAFNLELPRSTLQQIKIGLAVPRGDLKFGDLVFFNTRRRQNPGHVGIYLWDDYFVHASTKYGVIISSMGEGYYHKKFVGARRIQEVYAIIND